jgi:hypothetical protein
MTMRIRLRHQSLTEIAAQVPTEVYMLQRVLILLTIIVAAASWVAAQGVSEEQGESLPKGLEEYLEARILESNGRFREAMEAYQRAVGPLAAVVARPRTSERGRDGTHGGSRAQRG